jgi:HAD superfamily hydrolase (TIGR01450 family)
VAALRRAGHRVAFCTNNSAGTVDLYVRRLEEAGIDAHPEEVVTSAQAVATLLEPGERAMAVADAGVVEALETRGVEVHRPGDGATVDAVVVGLWRSFDYAAMDAATVAVARGARFLATNTDRRFPREDGYGPGCGALVASIATATGATPEVAGKPHAAIVRLVTERFGEHGVVVGDTLATDGALAEALGWTFGLVLTGNTTPEDVPSGADPAWVAPDLATLVARHGGRSTTAAAR